jgi:hypothetical protein
LLADQTRDTERRRACTLLLLRDCPEGAVPVARGVDGLKLLLRVLGT